MGNDVAAPDTRNSPITAAYVIRHSRQTASEQHERRVAEIQDDGERERRQREQIAGHALPHGCGRAVTPATDSSAAHTNQIAPKIATGTPRNVPKRLWYTCVQLTVALTSQKLV